MLGKQLADLDIRIAAYIDYSHLLDGPDRAEDEELGLLLTTKKKRKRVIPIKPKATPEDPSS
jgi:hypothetical protein